MKGLTNLVVLALVAAGGYYAYTNLASNGDSASAGSSADDGFNCRGAKNVLAARYQCRSDPNCSLSSEQESELRKLEADIEENCN